MFIYQKENPATADHIERQNNFKPIEAILLLGEPINWECHLQLLLDVLMLNGDPRSKFKLVPKPHLPIIACNKDLTFKGAAHLPRFGHGAFLECLEILYKVVFIQLFNTFSNILFNLFILLLKKVTNNDLIYEVLMGKPCVVTYEFATMQVQKLVNGKSVKKFFIIG